MHGLVLIGLERLAAAGPVVAEPAESGVDSYICNIGGVRRIAFLLGEGYVDRCGALLRESVVTLGALLDLNLVALA